MSNVKCASSGANQLTRPGNKVQKASSTINHETENKNTAKIVPLQPE